jgi:antitoxin HigA-1
MPTPTLPTHRTPSHPGEILREEFLVPMEITQTRLAEVLRVSVQRINELVNGKRGITPETAWLLASAFRTSPEFWMNLQAQHDLAIARPTRLPRALR